MIKKFLQNEKFTITSFLWRILQMISRQGVPLFIFVFSSSVLSVEEFGNYNYLLAIGSLIILFSDFGISFAASKIFAEYHVKDKEKLPVILFNTILAIIAFSIIISTGFFVWGKEIFHENSRFVIYLIPIIIFVPLTALYDGLYRAKGKFKQISILSVLSGLLTLVASFFLIKNFSIEGSFISYMFFYLSLLILLIIFDREIKISFDRKIIKQITKYSFIIGISGIGQFLFSRVDVLFLGSYGYIKEISYYEYVFKMLTLVLIPFYALNQVIAPQITKLFYQQKIEKVKSEYKKYLLFTFLSGIIIAVSLIIFRDVIFNMVGKYNTPLFRDTFYVMIPVFFTQILISIIPVAFTVATGNAKYNMFFLMLFGGLNCLLDYIFINMFGYIGIIYATFVAKLLSDILFIPASYYAIFNYKKR